MLITYVPKNPERRPPERFSDRDLFLILVGLIVLGLIAFWVYTTENLQ